MEKTKTSEIPKCSQIRATNHLKSPLSFMAFLRKPLWDGMFGRFHEDGAYSVQLDEGSVVKAGSDLFLGGKRICFTNLQVRRAPNPLGGSALATKDHLLQNVRAENHQNSTPDRRHDTIRIDQALAL